VGGEAAAGAAEAAHHRGGAIGGQAGRHLAEAEVAGGALEQAGELAVALVPQIGDAAADRAAAAPAKAPGMRGADEAAKYNPRSSSSPATSASSAAIAQAMGAAAAPAIAASAAPARASTTRSTRRRRRWLRSSTAVRRSSP
jgi:hypothetical protein